jgi:hypothetical protein
MGARCLELQDEYFPRLKEESRWQVIDTEGKSAKETVEEIFEKIVAIN